MKIFLILQLIIFFGFVNAQKTIYDVQRNGYIQLMQAIDSAAKTHKHVLVQVGGNWCPWCIRFHEFCKNVSSVDSIIKASYVWVPLNYSRENKSEEAIKYLEHPERFGFPVLVVLDSKGRRIHTQDSEYLEKGKSYDTLKV
ncbi:MAG: thioredoxin family protein, partial [Bacteroidales bacterium]|nr:thioredoxin family protein [Bacteroidales bacterium]